MNHFLTGIVSWLRAGYPDGVPENDYRPVLALLCRRLSSDEVLLVAQQMMQLSQPGDIDIGAEILKVTDQLPAPPDIERVRAKLAAHGWPLDAPRDAGEAG